MVRTDSREMKLDAFVRPSSLQPIQHSSAQIDPANQNSPTEMDTTTGTEGCAITTVYVSSL